MSRPPLHALQGFVAAVRHGNLTRAAESLNLTVSALSHQMRALEERLGYALLVRGARGVSPTADGQRLLERIAPHLEAIADALHPYAARRGQVLTISLLPSMASAWLLPRLGGFLSAHPDIEVNVQSQTGVVDFERSPDVDAALRVGRGQWPGTVAEHLFDDELAPMASPDLVARMGGIDARPLPEWPLLGDGDGQWNRWFAQAGQQPPSRYVAVLDDTEAHHRAAAAGVGVALGRMTRARLLLEAGQLVLLSPRRLRTANGHWLVYPERSRQHRGFTLFREWLLEQATAYAQSDGSRPG